MHVGILGNISLYWATQIYRKSKQNSKRLPHKLQTVEISNEI